VLVQAGKVLRVAAQAAQAAVVVAAVLVLLVLLGFRVLVVLAHQTLYQAPP
jgi:hypothetical protein